MNLGGSWPPFGRGLGRSGPSFGHFWALLDCFFGVLNRAFFKHRSKIGSERPFGSILDRFWRVLGGFGEDVRRIWEVFEWVLEGCGKDFRHTWHDLALLGQIL